MNIGKNVVIYGNFEIRSPWNIVIGDGTIIGDKCLLDGRNKIIIGKNVNISSNVSIWTEQHDYNDPLFRCNDKGGFVMIGDLAWISFRAVILPKTNIGEGTVVAACALVVKDCEEYGLYAGVPAKKIGNRNRDIKYEFNGNFLPFM